MNEDQNNQPRPDNQVTDSPPPPEPVNAPEVTLAQEPVTGQVGTVQITPDPIPPVGSTQPLPAPGSTLAGQPKKSKGKKIALIVVIIAAFLLAAGGAGAFFYLNHLNNKPEKVLADALANTAADLLDQKPSTTVTKVVVDSKENNIKVTVDLDTKTVGKNGEVAANVRFEAEDTDISVKASAIMIGSKEYYFKIDDLRETVRSAVQAYVRSQDGSVSVAEINETLSALDPLIKKVDGVWVQVKLDDLEGLTSDASVSKCSEAVENLRLSDQDQKDLKELFADNQFIVAKEVYDQKDVDGDKSFHYLIDFSDDAAISFAKGAIQISSLKAVAEACDVKEADIKKPESTSENEPDEMTVELWVSSKSRRLTKAQIKAHDTEVSLDFATTLKLDVGGLKVEQPSDFVTMEQLQQDLQQLFQGM